VSSDVASRARSGTKILALRNAVTQVLRIASSVVVARWLSPEDFGLFAVLIYISGLPMFVQNLGLAGALIVQREEPTAEQWSSAFFLQLIVAFLLFALIAATGPFLLKVFDAPASAYALLVTAALPSLILAFSFYQTVWLQRHLEFKKFATAAFASDIVSVVSLCALAIAGFGIWTLVLAPALTGLVQGVALFLMCPWVPRLVLNLTSLRRLLSVGIPMQVNVAMPAALDGWTPFYTSRMLGAEVLGFLSLAQRLAFIPASYLQILSQVAAPSFSRLQADQFELIARLGNILHRLALVSGCGYLILAPWVPDVVAFVYGERWRFAGHLLQYLGLSVVLIAMTSVIGPALNALGRHWLRTIPIVIGYLFAWAFAPLLISALDASGLGLAIVSFACLQLLGSALCLPDAGGNRAKVVAIAVVTSCLALLAATALPHFAGLGVQALVAISTVGVLVVALSTVAEWFSSNETTLRWVFRMLKPQR